MDKDDAHRVELGNGRLQAHEPAPEGPAVVCVLLKHGRGGCVVANREPGYYLRLEQEPGGELVLIEGEDEHGRTAGEIPISEGGGQGMLIGPLVRADRQAAERAGNPRIYFAFGLRKEPMPHVFESIQDEDGNVPAVPEHWEIEASPGDPRGELRYRLFGPFGLVLRRLNR